MGEGDGIALIGKEFLRVFRHKVGVDGDHGDVILVSAIQRIKVRELLDTRRAVSRPEVDKGDLTPLLLEMEGASIITGDREIRKLLPNLAAHRRVAVVIHFLGDFDHRRSFGFSRSLRRSWNRRLGRNLRCSGNLRRSRNFRRGRCLGRSGHCGPGFFGRNNAFFGSGIQHIEPQKCKAQRQQCNRPEDPGHLLALIWCIRPIPCASLLGCLQGDFPRLD